MYNKNQITELEAKIAAVIREEGSDETPGVENLVATIASPNTGLIYKPGPNGNPGHLVIAEGWVTDNYGNIVRADDVTGPGAM